LSRPQKEMINHPFSFSVINFVNIKDVLPTPTLT
jgi:hypothetical protein